MTKTDKYVIAFVTVLAVLFYMIFNMLVFSDNPEKVLICVDGKEYATYNLREIPKTKTVRVETEYGVNVVELANDGVRVTEASCPDKVDVHSGKIEKSGQMLVCVPNRFTVRLYGKDTAVDKVAY